MYMSSSPFSLSSHSIFFPVSGICSCTNKKPRWNDELDELGMCHSWEERGNRVILYRYIIMGAIISPTCLVKQGGVDGSENFCELLDSTLSLHRLHGKEACSNCACCLRMTTLPRPPNVSLPLTSNITSVITTQPRVSCLQTCLISFP